MTRGLSRMTSWQRAPRPLCGHAEEAWRSCGGEPPVYVVGTEVPVPGGAQETLSELAVTEPRAALATVTAHRSAFIMNGLHGAWDRVVGLVVQPGVEFDHDRVIDYRSEKARHLSKCLDGLPNLVFEAHSTDYQTEGALRALVRDHFAILKVGPAVTFALREAIWALDRIEREWHGEAHAKFACARPSSRPCVPIHGTGASTTTAAGKLSICSWNTA